MCMSDYSRETDKILDNLYKPAWTAPCACGIWQTDKPLRDGTWYLAHDRMVEDYVAIRWHRGWENRFKCAVCIDLFDAFAKINPYETPT